jgi:hypothetical protein
MDKRFAEATTWSSGQQALFLDFVAVYLDDVCTYSRSWSRIRFRRAWAACWVSASSLRFPEGETVLLPVGGDMWHPVGEGGGQGQAGGALLAAKWFIMPHHIECLACGNRRIAFEQQGFFIEVFPGHQGLLRGTSFRSPVGQVGRPFRQGTLLSACFVYFCGP